MTPVTVAADGRPFMLAPPRWGPWQGALDRAAGGPEALLEECLLVSLRDADGYRLTHRDLAGLSAEAGDRLLGALLELIEQERAALDLSVGAATIEGRGISLRVRGWTFGERNDALRRSLRLQDGQVTVDMSAYELQMVLQCVTHAEGQRLDAAEVQEWPVPLGEAVIGLLDRLNGVESHEAEILQACVRTGQAHPDIALVELCRAFGWSPAEAERLDARTAERLWAAWRVLAGGAPHGVEAPVPVTAAATAAVAGAPEPEGVTRILVRD